MSDGPKELFLTPTEVCFAVCLAAQRIATKPPTDRFLAGKLSPFASHLIGVMGEMAVAKILGSKVDQKISRNGDGHRADMLDRTGRKIEIKTCTFSGKDAMMKLHPEELMDDTWYVLVIVQMPDCCKVFPPIWGLTIREIARPKNFGYGERLTVTAEQIEEINA